MKQADFHNAIRILTGDAPPRVWSLIVTVFGDLAQGSGDAISGPVLSDILAPLGVRPETMRVALHRLRADGWIVTEKRGRQALHRLTPSGRTQSLAASELIYAQTRPADEAWHMLVFAPAHSAQEQSRAAVLGEEHYVPLAPGVYLGNGAANQNIDGALVLTGALGSVPIWLRDVLISPAQLSAIKDLIATLDLLATDIPGFDTTDQLQIASLRALIVHRWRKLVLRLPVVPDVLFGENWEGRLCRARVGAALEALPRPDLSTL